MLHSGVYLDNISTMTMLSPKLICNCRYTQKIVMAMLSPKLISNCRYTQKVVMATLSPKLISNCRYRQKVVMATLSPKLISNCRYTHKVGSYSSITLGSVCGEDPGLTTSTGRALMAHTLDIPGTHQNLLSDKHTVRNLLNL